MLRSLVLLSLPSILLVGCGGGTNPDLNSTVGKLAAARSRWAGSATRSYAFTVRRSGFLPPSVSGPARVTVKNGEVVSVVAAGENSIDASAFASIDTIEELFSLVQNGLDQKAAALDASYDATLGFPTQIAIDPNLLAADDETNYTVTEFTAL